MHTIPLIQFLRQTIKTVYNTNFHPINEMGDDGGIVGVDGVRG